VVHDAHMFVLWFHTSNVTTFFSMVQHREVFHRLGVQDVTEFDSD
jgi:hypothetical protein